MTELWPDNLVQGQYAQVSEHIRLHYVSAGDPAQPPLLLLHGFPEFWRAWLPVMAPLAQHFWVIAPDLRGFHLSSKPKEVEAYRADVLVGDILGLMDQLHIKQAFLAAHDWGGAVAWNLAAAHTQRLRRLCILNSPHPVSFARALATDPAQQRGSAYMNLLRAADAEDKFSANDFDLLQRLLSASSPCPWFEQVKTHYLEAWRQPGALSGMLNYYRASPLYPPVGDDPGAKRLRLDPERFAIRNLPTRLIWGMADPALLPVLLEGLEQWIEPYSLVKLESASHWLMHEQPEQVASAMLEHLLG